MWRNPHTQHTHTPLPPQKLLLSKSKGKKTESRRKGARSDGVLVLASCELTVALDKPLSLTSPQQIGGLSRLGLPNAYYKELLTGNPGKGFCRYKVPS